MQFFLLVSIMINWVLMSCSLLDVTSVSVYIYHDDGGDTFLRNVHNHLQDYMVSQSRRP
jgi:hypothetical protein